VNRRIVGLAIAAAIVTGCSSGPTLPTAQQQCAALMDSTRANNGPPDSTVAKTATDILWIYGPNSGGGFRYFEFTWPPCMERGGTNIRP